MNLLHRFSHSTMVLLACLLLGGAVGAFVPEIGTPAHVVGQIYLAAVSMAATPLLVVATFFGLRQTMRLPHPLRRTTMIAGLAVVLVAGAAVAGTAFGLVASPGGKLDHDTRAYLGSLVQHAGGDTDNAEMLLRGVDPPAVADRPLSGILPNNFFRELVEGHSLGILSCAILFGLAFALARPQNGALDNLLEGIYRALELIISRATLLVPVLAFSVAAHLMSDSDPRTLHAMGGFLACFVLLVAVFSIAALVIVQRRSGQPFVEVVRSLKSAMLVSLASASSTASIPHTIEAMSERLGFSRGVVELVVPTSSVFLRAGTALYVSILVVFVANLYDRSLDAADLGLICFGSVIAAFASAGYNSAASVGFAGMVLSMLQLPVEAALALFVAIDLLCEGPRNLLTLLASCVLIAWVSAGLPSDRVVVAQAEEVAPPKPLQFSFSRSQLGFAAGCCAVAAALLVLLGIGVGVKRASGDGLRTAIEYGAAAPGTRP